MTNFPDELTQIVLDELVASATSNVEDFTICNGTSLRLKNLSDTSLRTSAIKEISQNKGKLSIRLHEKTTAIKMLGDYYGMFTDLNLALGALRKYGIFLTLDNETGKWSVREEATLSQVD